MRKTALVCLLAGILALTGCSQSESGLPSKATKSVTRLSFQLDGVAEPQHGGLYMALAKGYFAEEGLDIRLIQGNTQTDVRGRVASGRAQLGQADGNDVLRGIRDGEPVVMVAAMFQHDPSAIIMQANHPADSFEDLAGEQVRAKSHWAFLDYLREVKAIQIRAAPMDFNLEAMGNDDGSLQQGYFIAEPYYMKHRGMNVKWLPVYQTGYDGIIAVIVNRSFAEQNPDLVRSFLRAYYKGQKAYFESDPAPAHRLMLGDNNSATLDFLEWSRQQIIDHQLVRGIPGRGGSGDYLRVSAERIERQIRQLETAGVLAPASVTAANAFNGTFLPD